MTTPYVTRGVSPTRTRKRNAKIVASQRGGPLGYDQPVVQRQNRSPEREQMVGNRRDHVGLAKRQILTHGPAMPQARLAVAMAGICIYLLR
jgi:hypothetical protein